MTGILTVTLNPALDMATATDAVRPDRKLRCDTPLLEPGGGGINVSRAILRLGGQSTAFVALGGPNGERLRALIAAEGVRLHAFPAPGDNRHSLSVSDRAENTQYRFVMPGPAWGPAETSAVTEAIGTAVQPGGILVMSGSQPPGVGDAFIPRLCAAVTRRGLRTVVDTSGAALRHLVETAGDGTVDVLRMDQLEAEGLAGRPLPDRADSAAFAGTLVARGAAGAVIIARGADGSVMADATRRVHVAAADVPVLSKIGAGDSFVGAFTLALSRGEEMAMALRHGAAAASAAVMTEATQLCRREDAERLLADCTLRDLP